MNTAQEILNAIINHDNSRMLLAKSIIPQSHNGIKYNMIRDELVLEAMKQIAELAFDAGVNETAYYLAGRGENPLSKEDFIEQLFPEKEEDYDLPNDWEPNYNIETPEERRDEAIKQQKLK